MPEYDRKEIAELVGLSPDASDETIRVAIAEKLASQRSHEDKSRRERALAIEDQRLVAAAIADGRVVASRAEHWRHVLATDRDANRALLASLAPGLPPSQRDIPASQAHSPKAELDRILANLGFPASSQIARPSAVYASAQSPAPASRPSPVRAGAPASQMTPAPRTSRDLIPNDFVPDPVLIRRGKPSHERTQREISDECMRRLSPRTAVGLPPPPPEDVWYWPSPNDHFRWNEETQQFEAKPNSQAARISSGGSSNPTIGGS